MAAAVVACEGRARSQSVWLLALRLPLHLNISDSPRPVCKMNMMPFKLEGMFQEINKSWHVKFFLQGTL